MAAISFASSAPAVSARPELAIYDCAVTTASLQVAQFFGKLHGDVLRAVRNLASEVSEEHARNFARMSQEVVSGIGATRQEPAYCMTREGFMLLAMDFTGTGGELAYIAALNRMAAELQKPAHDPQRIQPAHHLAAQAAAQVTRTVFDAVMAADAAGWPQLRCAMA